MPPPSHPQNFIPLTPSISLYKPPSSPTSPSPNLTPSRFPSLLVLCTWMAASPKHIQKYTSHYTSLFPTTSILLVQCSLPAIFHSSSRHRTLLSPAREIIRSFSTDAGNIVLHAMSNGGSTLACHLATQLHEEEIDKKNVWRGFNKVILDCAPSYPTVRGAVDAISFSLPRNPIIRFLGRCLLRLVIFTYLIVYVKFARREDGIMWIRRVLNDGNVFGREAERLYVFAQQDALVQEWAVEMHANEAEGRGYRVRRERFEKGMHCALGVGEGGERYWGDIEGFLKGR